MNTKNLTGKIYNAMYQNIRQKCWRLQENGSRHLLRVVVDALVQNGVEYPDQFAA
ncbi:hypothetical protein [Desulfoscipio gibsoniae]